MQLSSNNRQLNEISTTSYMLNYGWEQSGIFESRQIERVLIQQKPKVIRTRNSIYSCLALWCQANERWRSTTFNVQFRQKCHDLLSKAAYSRFLCKQKQFHLILRVPFTHKHLNVVRFHFGVSNCLAASTVPGYRFRSNKLNCFFFFLFSSVYPKCCLPYT